VTAPALLSGAPLRTDAAKMRAIDEFSELRREAANK